jgi:hypothetical protein
VEFSVNSTALTGLADMLDRRWQDYESGRTYLKGNAHFSVTGPGVLNTIFGTHQKIVDQIDTFLATAAEGFAGPCSTAVSEANALYLHSDRSAVARNDAAMPAPRPDGQCPPVPTPTPGSGTPTAADQTLSAAVFADPVCPTSWYREPPDHRADHPLTFGYFDVVSPTSWGREAIWKITGVAAHFGLIDRPYDVLAEAVEPLCGDWAGYLRCADVYDNLASAIGDTARCVTGGATTIDRVWTGNAADTCAQAMQRFAVQVGGAVDPLHKTASTYREVADAVYRQGQAVAALVSLILDEAAESAFLSGGEELSLPLELATETSDLIRLVEKVREVASLIAKAREVASASMDSASSALSGFGLLTDKHAVPVFTPAVPTLPVQGITPPK